MGLLAMPAMLRAGYNIKVTAGVITAGGCLGILIPPSVMLIVYGAVAGVSVVQLYAGAFFPGIMLARLYIALRDDPRQDPARSRAAAAGERAQRRRCPRTRRRSAATISNKVLPGLIGALRRPGGAPRRPRRAAARPRDDADAGDRLRRADGAHLACADQARHRRGHVGAAADGRGVGGSGSGRRIGFCRRDEFRGSGAAGRTEKGTSTGLAEPPAEGGDGGARPRGRRAEGRCPAAPADAGAAKAAGRQGRAGEGARRRVAADSGADRVLDRPRRRHRRLLVGSTRSSPSRGSRSSRCCWRRSFRWR